MRRQQVQRLACPTCAAGELVLSVSKVEDDRVLEGSLRCMSCHKDYVITEGIARLLEKRDLQTSPSKSFGYQWKKWHHGRFEKGKKYGLDLEAETAKFFHYSGLDKHHLQGKAILDAGCASGRLAKTLAQYGAQVYGLDVHSGLGEVYQYCKDVVRITIVQGSILSPPIKKGSFDVVWSEGVIHHTGDPQTAFTQLAGLVKPGGKLIVWVYWDKRLNVHRKIRNMLKVGHKLPMPLLFSLCCILGFSLYIREIVIRTLGREIRVTPWRLHAFRLFDHISPLHNSRHSEEEVFGWFEANGFINIKRVTYGELGVRGEKPQDSLNLRAHRAFAGRDR